MSEDGRKASPPHASAGDDIKNTLARAFILDANSEWITVATGVAVTVCGEEGVAVTVCGEEGPPTLTVSLHDETEGGVLFSTTFHKDQDISRQQGNTLRPSACNARVATVVTWTSGDGADVALSFENEGGCDNFWGEVCQFLERPVEYAPQEEAAAAAAAAAEGAPMSEEDHGSAIVLPDEVEFSTIPDIDAALERATNAPADVRRSVCVAITARQYVSRLLELFRIAEDLDSRETLFRLYSIFKHLVLLNNPSILREILAEQNVFHVAGVFEWDPAYPETRPGYRQYLLDRQRFQQVVDLENDSLVSLIHQTFRTQYLKDVVLPRILDEETFGSLLFMVRCNYAEIIEMLEGETDFMTRLVPLFGSEDPTECEAVLKFLKEFLSIAKTSSNGRHLRIYQEGAFSELLRFLQRMLSLEANGGICRVLATDVLIAVTQHDPNIIRSFLVDGRVAGGERGQLLTTVIDRVIDSTTAVGLRWQLVAVLRTLLDSAGPLGLSLPNDDFLNLFYPDYALRLLSPLVELDKSKKVPPPGQGMIVFTPEESDLYFNCCELLCSFIVQHKYRIKYLLFRSFIVHNALLLLQCRDKYLRLCAIRVIRTMVGTGDDFYFRFFMKQSLLKPLIDQAVGLGSTDNAISSALVEFFFHIRDKKYKMLLGHLVEGYKADLERIKSAPVYRELSSAHEEATNPSAEASSEKEAAGRPRDAWLGVDRSEEAYFSTADEDEDENGGGRGDGGESRNGRDEYKDEGEYRDGGEYKDEGEYKDGGEYREEESLSPMLVEEISNDGSGPTADSAAPSSQMATTWHGDEDERNKRMKY